MINQKKIVVVEMLYPVGHKQVDKKMIELLNSCCKVTVLNYKGFIQEDRELDNVSYIDLPLQILINRRQPLIQASIIFNLFIIKQILKDVEYDTLLFLSVNNFILGIIKRMFPQKKIFVMHHNDIDALKTDRMINAFKKNMNSVEHITFGDFIKHGLVNKTGCDSKKVFAIPLPITSSIIDLNNTKERKKIIVGLGSSNDDEFIKKCIEIDKENLFEVDYKIILRSSHLSYQGKVLNVITGYLDDETYNDYFLNSSAIIICYPQHFKLRYSTTLIFAIVQNGRVLFNDFPMARVESKNYPHNMQIFKDARDLFLLNNDFFETNIDEEERNRYLKDHSDETIIEKIKEIFNC